MLPMPCHIWHLELEMKQATKRGGWNKGLKTGPKRRQGIPVHTITERRHALYIHTWETVKRMLQTHLESPTTPAGEASRIAKFIGVRPSQIHRYSCPVCEHDQEPSYSVGASILLYLLHYNKQASSPPIIDVIATPWFY